MSVSIWMQLLTTAILGGVGLWLGYSMRRQLTLRLAERRLDAYERLWKITDVGQLEPHATALTAARRRDLHKTMKSWYFENGIFMSDQTRNLFAATRRNLICAPDRFRPVLLAEEWRSLDRAEVERRRGCVALRQISLLRTQLKADLALHLGYTYVYFLYREDRALLRECGISPRRPPWRVPLRSKLRTSRPYNRPCVCRLCESAG